MLTHEQRQQQLKNNLIVREQKFEAVEDADFVESAARKRYFEQRINTMIGLCEAAISHFENSHLKVEDLLQQASKQATQLIIDLNERHVGHR